MLSFKGVSTILKKVAGLTEDKKLEFDSATDLAPGFLVSMSLNIEFIIDP